MDYDNIFERVVPIEGQQRAEYECTRQEPKEKKTRFSIKKYNRVLYAAGALFAIGTAVFAMSVPRDCQDVPECAAVMGNMKEALGSSPQTRVVALMVLLSKELVNLYTVKQEKKTEQMMAFSFSDPVLPLALMCVVVALLLATEAACALGGGWVLAVPPTFGGGWRPLYSLRYVEWLVNVPLLIVISGHCSLNQPFPLMVAPAILSDVYMVLAWMAMVTDSAAVRVVLIVVSLSGYGVASGLMLNQLVPFWRSSSPDLPRRRFRTQVHVALVVVFGLYGLVYLLAASHLIDAHQEFEMYANFDFNIKLILTFILSFLRSAERRNSAWRLIQHHGILNNAFMSLLRSSFDYVVPCGVCELGHCVLPDTPTPETTALSDLVGRPVEGLAFQELIASQAGQLQFTEHMKATLAAAWASTSPREPGIVPKWTLYDPENNFGYFPETMTVFMYDLCCPNTEFGSPGVLRAAVHLSVTGSKPSDSRQVILALRVERAEAQKVLAQEKGSRPPSKPRCENLLTVPPDAALGS